MNSLERVFNSVQGKPVDRRPISLTLSLYGARLTKCPLEEYYSRSEAYIEGQIAVKETFDPDILFGPFALVREAEAFGSQSIFLKDYPPNLKTPAVTSGQDVSQLNIPDIDSHPRLLYIRESIQALASQFANEKAIAGILMSPTDMPALIMGIETWLDTLLFHEKTASQMLDLTSRYFIQWANSLFAAGAHIIVLPLMFCNPGIITEKIIQKKIIPLLMDVFKEIQGPIVCHHGGARLSPFIEYFSSLPNIAAFLLDSRDNFSEARSKIGDQQVLMGNIDGPGLAKLTTNEITHKCTEILRDRQNDPHFILGTSNADIMLSTPPENIHAIFQSVKEFQKEMDS